MSSKQYIRSLVFLMAFPIAFLASGQNLVRNCQFESMQSCPNASGQINKCRHWISPGEGTPDFVHSCNNGNVGVPNNIWGYQEARSGSAYVNIISYSILSANREYREYVCGILDCDMQAGMVYDVSFYLSCADGSHYAVDGIGAWFSAEIPVQGGSNSDEVIDIGGAPHISSPDGIANVNKEDWVKIEGSYTAQGGERFITIGNFKYNSNLTLHDFTSWSANIASYYIDDVSVVPREAVIDLGPDTTICPGSSITFDVENLCNNVELVWEDGSTELTRTITEPGTYGIGGFIGCSNFYEEVTISFPPEPGFFLPGDTVICPGRIIEIPSEGSYASYQWHDGSEDPDYIADTEGTYWLTVTDDYGCHYTDTLVIEGLSDPVFDLGPDTIFCLGQSIRLDPGIDSSFHSFLWNDNSRGIVRVISDSGVYWLRVSNPCGEMTDTIMIGTFNCDPAFEAPNAFTPNADGLNDVFKLKAENISNFSMFIFDRWGTMIFESNQIDDGWDGKFRGQVVASGTYVWMAVYNTSPADGQSQRVKTRGLVTVLR
ncbi:MAG: gliding motility-associated C-terminal domain-containing protein [Bacteroidales bacterium]|nr:gliding motility-associated C-terminal domain-containing protein [Bacteroidales bacterium]